MLSTKTTKNTWSYPRYPYYFLFVREITFKKSRRLFKTCNNTLGKFKALKKTLKLLERIDKSKNYHKPKGHIYDVENFIYVKKSHHLQFAIDSYNSQPATRGHRPEGQHIVKK